MSRAIVRSINGVLRSLAGTHLTRADTFDRIVRQALALQAQIKVLHQELEPHRNLHPDSLYEQLFSVDSLEQKRFYNIGAGSWRHQYWTNVDHHSDYYAYSSTLIDIDWDVSRLQTLPIETATAELVYSSHTVEHLQNHHVDHLLNEAYRILKPGGVVRITTPNIEMMYWAIMRGDGDFNRRLGFEISFFDDPKGFSRERFPLLFVNEIATQLVQGVGPERKNARYMERADAIMQVLKTMPLAEACDHFTGLVDYDLHRLAPGHHVNWWTNEKLQTAMRRAGFKHTIVSVPGGSLSPVMRNRDVFDNQMPTYSIYVEAIKD